MPELPEVETIKRVIEPQIQGRMITKVAVRRPEVAAYPEADEFCRRLTGQMVSHMARQGKFLIIHLENKERIVLHLRMTGGLLLAPAQCLEENLAALPDCAKSAVAGCRGTLTNLSYSVDANGNISVAISGTSDPDGKIAKENAERRAKEKKAAEEKAAERRKEKKAEEEKAAERRAEKKAANEARTEMGEYTVSATGTDIKAVTEKIIAATSGTSAPTWASFDIKA